MNAWPWLLLIDNVIGIGCVVLFCWMRTRLTLSIGVFLALILVMTNILVFIGYRNWFIIALPFIILVAVSIIGRPFLRSSTSTRLGKNLSLFILVVAIIVTILSFVFVIGMITFGKVK